MIVQINCYQHMYTYSYIHMCSIGAWEGVCICDMYIEFEVATVVFVHCLGTTGSLTFPASLSSVYRGTK